MVRSGFGIKFLKFFGLGIILVILALHSNANAYYEKKLLEIDVYSATELNSLINDHQLKVKVLEDQVDVIKKEINWLVLKINRLQDTGEKPAKNLISSVKAKENKIKILEKEKTRLEKIIAHYTNAFEIKLKKANEKIASKKIDFPKPLPVKKESVKPLSVKDTQKSDVMTKASPVLDNQLIPVKKEDIQAAVKKAGLADWVDINGDNTCLRMETSLPILFSTGSADVAKEYTSFLKKLALFLKSYDVKILVNGYADTDPIHTKQFPSNFELGAKRAANIVHTMVNQGLKPSIFKIQTTGEHRFAAKNPSPNKSFQRRAHVTVIFSG